MQAANKPDTGQRLLTLILAAQSHQARHFRFGDGDFLAAPLGQGNVCNFVIGFLDGNGFAAHKILLYV